MGAWVIHCLLKWGFTRTFPGNQDETMKLKFIFINSSSFWTPLPTSSQSVSHRQFYQCVNPKKKVSLRHPIICKLLVVLTIFRHPFDYELTRDFKNYPNWIEMCLNINFTNASWLPGYVHVKPHFNHNTTLGTKIMNFLSSSNSLWPHTHTSS